MKTNEDHTRHSGQRPSIGPPSYNTPAHAGQYNPNVEGAVSAGVSIKMTGVIQVILGVASFILGLIAVYLECYLSFYAMPVWAGVLFYFSTGVTGVRTYLRKMSKGMTLTYMVMCICSAVISGVLLVMYIKVTVAESYAYHCYSTSQCKEMRVRVLVNILIIFVCFVELATSITGASLTCSRMCRCCCKMSPSQGVNMIYYNTQSTAGQVPTQQYTIAGGNNAQSTVNGNGKPAYSSQEFVTPPHHDTKVTMEGVKLDADNKAKYSPSVRKSNVPKDNKSTYVTASELRSHQAQGGEEIEKAPL